MVLEFVISFSDVILYSWALLVHSEVPKIDLCPTDLTLNGHFAFGKMGWSCDLQRLTCPAECKKTSFISVTMLAYKIQTR